jgi:hydrogenase expression/formation protein HypD
MRVRMSPDSLQRLAGHLTAEAGPGGTFMEVCGTHTMSVARHGLRDLLPQGIRLVSGPGCPVCVTAMGDLDRVVALCRRPGITVATFGDLIRVPASRTSLAGERAAGSDVRVVYSARDAVEMAAALPAREVVLVGIGFETTAPTTAAAVVEARRRDIRNFSVLSLHKTMPPALRALLDLGETPISGFILPGHVSVITGSTCFEFLADEYGIAGVVTGFEPGDILEALLMLLRQTAPKVENQYTRAVSPQGNPVAREVMERVYEPCDADWRGLGVIPGSGLGLRPEFADHDAAARFAVEAGEALEPDGCRCGEVLRGVTDPVDCALFGRRCTPLEPVGACMVSSEGACAARYRYRGLDD